MNENMTKTTGQESSNQTVNEPITIKDRVIVLLVSLVLIGFGVATWTWPDLLSSTGYQPGGRGSRRVWFFVNLVWNRPVGTVAGLFGLLVGWGALTKNSSEGITEVEKHE